MMDTETFIHKIQDEGLDYTLTHYFSRKDLTEIQNPVLRKAALDARDAILRLEAMIQAE